MSPPALNARPAPVSTHARTSGSASSASSVRGSSLKNSTSIAFSFSARSIVTVAVPSPCRWTSNTLRYYQLFG